MTTRRSSSRDTGSQFRRSNSLSSASRNKPPTVPKDVVLPTEKRNVVVSVRIRPLLGDMGDEYIFEKREGCFVSETNADTGTRFDHVFDHEVSNEDIFKDVGQQCVRDVVNGWNATVFMYGQTGSGKTHTMTGVAGDGGLIPRSTTMLFELIDQYKNASDMLNILNQAGKGGNDEEKGETAADGKETNKDEDKEKAKAAVTSTEEVSGSFATDSTVSVRSQAKDKGETDSSTAAVEPMRTRRQFLVRASYIEIYNERVFDLCAKRKELQTKFNPEKDEFYAQDVKEMIVNSAKDLDQIRMEGEKAKSMGVSNLNEHSSRSHSIFSIVVESADIPVVNDIDEDSRDKGDKDKDKGGDGNESKGTGAREDIDSSSGSGSGSGSGSSGTGSSGGRVAIKLSRRNTTGNVLDDSTTSNKGASNNSGGGATSSSSSSSNNSSSSSSSKQEHRKGVSTGLVRVGRLNLVDLAGSETLSDRFGAAQQKETVMINKSLTSLKDVIHAKAKRSAHVPFRNSELTKLLKSSLGGNSVTHMICTITPAPKQRKESRYTLAFGSLAQKVENLPRQNETASDNDVLLKRYQAQVSQLQDQLNSLLANTQSKNKSLEDEVSRLKKQHQLLLGQQGSYDVKEVETKSKKQLTELKTKLSEEKKMRLVEREHGIRRDSDLAQTLAEQEQEYRGLQEELRKKYDEEYTSLCSAIAAEREELHRQSASVERQWDSYRTSRAELDGREAEVVALKHKLEAGLREVEVAKRALRAEKEQVLLYQQQHQQQQQGNGTGGGGGSGSDPEAAVSFAVSAERKRRVLVEKECDDLRSMVVALQLQLEEFGQREAGHSTPRTRIQAAVNTANGAAYGRVAEGADRHNLGSGSRGSGSGSGSGNDPFCPAPPPYGRHPNGRGGGGLEDDEDDMSDPWS